jgi:hypothetical protein
MGGQNPFGMLDFDKIQSIDFNAVETYFERGELEAVQR